MGCTMAGEMILESSCCSLALLWFRTVVQVQVVSLGPDQGVY